MSGVVASQDVYVNGSSAFSIIGSGGGGGGGVPNNLVVSTVTVAQYVSTPALIVSTINGSQYNPGGVPNNLVVSTLTVRDNVSTTFMSIPAGGTISLASTFVLPSGVGGNVLNMSGPGGINMISGNGTIALQGAGGAKAPVSIPGNLTVSTINGQVPGGGSAPSTIINWGGFRNVISGFATTSNSTWPNDATGYLKQSISTIPGNTYRMDFSVGLQPVQPSVTPATIPADNAMSFTIQSGVTNIKADMVPTADVYNISRGVLSSFNASYSVPFLAQASTTNLVFSYLNNEGNAFTFTNSTIVSSLTGILVTNLGVI